MIQRLRSGWTIFRIALEERLVYRGDFALGTLMRFLPIVTQIFLWSAIFETVKDAQGRDDLAGYRFGDMVAYYLLVMVARAFSSMPGLASGIALQIRNGEIKKFMIQPVDMISFLLISRVAHKTAYYSVAVLPFALVFYLCRGYFPSAPPPGVMLAFACSLIFGFLMGFFLEAAIGMIGFWFNEVSSLLFVYMLFSFFLSGHMFPLDLLPKEGWLGIVASLVRYLPLQYLAYFPAAVYLEKLTWSEILLGLAVEAGWLLALMLLCRFLFARGAGLRGIWWLGCPLTNRSGTSPPYRNRRRFGSEPACMGGFC